MYLIDYFLFLIIISFIVIFFTIILSVFGSIFIYFLHKKSKFAWDLTNLEFILISYAIGVSIYLSISYLVDLFQVFNFYFIFLPILVSDLIFIIYLYRIKKLNNIFKNFMVYLKTNKRDVIIMINILILIFSILSFRWWPILFKNSSLISKDPIYWTKAMFYILDYGHINYDWHMTNYPAGFTFFSSGYLLSFPNKIIQYFFMKFASFPFFCFYILVMYAISKRVFKNKKYMIYLSLILILSFNFLLQRAIAFYPSLIANLLIFISLIIILTKAPNYLLGFFIPTVYLIHNVSGFFFIASLGLLYLIKILSSYNNFNNIKKLFKEIFLISLITVLILIPYLWHSYIIYKRIFIDILGAYTQRLLSIGSTYLGSFKKSSLLLIINNFAEDFLNFLEVDKLNRLIWYRAIGFFFFFAIGGLFLRKKKKDKDSQDFINSLKIGLILVFLVYYITFLFNIDYITSNIYYSLFNIRVIETFAPHIILLAALTIEWISEQTIKIWNNYKLKNKTSHNQSGRRKLCDKVLNIKIFLIVLIIVPPTIYTISREKIYYSYNYNYFVENIFYIYNNIPEGSKLAARDFNNDNNQKTRNAIYDILYEYEIILYNCTVDLTYMEFYNFCVDNDIEYLILKKSCFNETLFLNEFENSKNYIKLYQPSDRNWLYGVYRFKK